MVIVDTTLSTASGGTSPQLDTLGDERGFPRAPAESDIDYRTRLRFLEEQVTPSAISDAVIGILDQYESAKFIADLATRSGLRVVREPFRAIAQGEQVGLEGTNAAFCDDITFCDDVLAPILRANQDVCAWFDITIPTPRDPNEARLFFEDGFFDDPLLGYPDLTQSEAITVPIATLAAELDRKRAACVLFRIIEGGDVELRRVPETGTTGVVGGWVTQAASAVLADLITSLQLFRGDDLYINTATGRGPGVGADAADFQVDYSALVEAPSSVSYVSLRMRVRRFDNAVGTSPDLGVLVQPPTAGAPVMVSVGTVDHDDWREVEVLLEENPVTTAPWTVADLTGVFRIGVANISAIGPTEELRVADLSLAFEASYG